MDIRDTADNFGGIANVWIIEAGILSGLPSLEGSATITQELLDELTIVPLHPYRARYSQMATDSDQGPLIEKSLTYPIPQDNEAYEAFFNRFFGKEVELIYKCVQGVYWLCFDRHYPGKFLSDFDSGGEPAEGKINTLSITGTTYLKRKRLHFT